MIAAYKNLFSEALSRSMQMNMDVTLKDMMPTNKKKIIFSNEENKAGVLKHLFRCLGDFKAEYVGQNSIEINLKFKSYLEDYLNTPVILTIGGIYFKGKEVFSFKEGDIKYLKDKITLHNQQINPHVWFTLPSLEIIDLTFLEYYNYKRGLPFRYQKEYEYIFDNINNIYENEKITYMPTLVGVENLNKINLIKSNVHEKIAV